MAMLKNVEIFYLKANPARPNATFNKKNPTWDVQLRTTDKAVRKEWEALNLSVKAIVPDEGAPYFRVNLKKKSIKEDGTPASFVKIVDGSLNDIDPDTVGNGSRGNVRIFQYEYDKTEGGGKGTASVLMGIQITKYVKYKPKKRDDDFGAAETETIELPDSDEEGEEGNDDTPQASTTPKVTTLADKHSPTAF